MPCSRNVKRFFHTDFIPIREGELYELRINQRNHLGTVTKVVNLIEGGILRLLILIQLGQDASREIGVRN